MKEIFDIKEVTVKSLRFDEEAWDGLLLQSKGFKFIFELHFAGYGQSYSVTCKALNNKIFYFESNKIKDVKTKVVHYLESLYE